MKPQTVVLLRDARDFAEIAESKMDKVCALNPHRLQADEDHEDRAYRFLELADKLSDVNSELTYLIDEMQAEAA